MMNSFIVTVSVALAIAALAIEGQASEIRHPAEYLTFATWNDELKQAVEWINEAVKQKSARVTTKDYLSKAYAVSQSILSGQPGSGNDDTGVSSYDVSQMDTLNTVLANLVELSHHDNPIQGHGLCSSLGVEGFVGGFELLEKSWYNKYSSKNYYDILYSTAKLPVYMAANGHLYYRTNCLGQPEIMFEAVKDNEDFIASEAKLDELIASLGAEVNDDMQLTQYAENLDLVNGRFSSNVMSAVAKKYQTGANNAGKNDLLFLFNYVDSVCREFRFTVADIMDTYNLGRLLFGEYLSPVSLPQKFHKINEYSRLCAQTLNQDLQGAIRENFSRNLGVTAEFVPVAVDNSVGVEEQNNYDAKLKDLDGRLQFLLGRLRETGELGR